MSPESTDGHLVPATPSEHDPHRMPRLVFSYGPPFSWLSKTKQKKLKRQIGKLKLVLKTADEGNIVKTVELPLLDDKAWINDRYYLAHLVFDDFFPEDNDYVIEVHWPRRKASIEQRVQVQQGDLEVQLDLMFVDTDSEDNKQPYRIANFFTTKVMPAQEDVRLFRNWTPTSEGEPNYVIRNNAKHKIHCTDPMKPYVGWIETQKDSQWEFFLRGVTHDSRAPGHVISTGRERWSKETIYEGETKPFPPGHHRYYVRYMLNDWVDCIANPANADDIFKGYFEHYELSDVFEIRDL